MDNSILKIQNEILSRKNICHELIIRKKSATIELNNVTLKNAVKKEQEEYYSNLLKALNVTITNESSRLQKNYDKEILGSKELKDFFQVRDKTIQEKLYHDPTFPSIFITSKRKGITPLRLVVYTLANT